MNKSLKNITSTALLLSCHWGPNRRHFSNKLTICNHIFMVVVVVLVVVVTMMI